MTLRGLKSKRRRRNTITEPISELNKIEIVECGEPLVSLAEHCPELLLTDEPDRMGNPRLFLVRATVARMLNEAQALLPEGHRLKIWSAYRTLEYQRFIYNEVYQHLKGEHPEWPENILRRETNRFVHPPAAKTPPGHCTGGAIDLTIVGPDGKELDMTSPYSAEIPERRLTAATYDPKISKEARRNRRLLLEVMEEVGFTNYAGEWWHFSYGDSGWTWRSGRKQAIYGLAEPTEEILKILRVKSASAPGPASP
jgi:D-alanyl-D-alanine dipeptidase